MSPPERDSPEARARFARLFAKIVVLHAIVAVAGFLIDRHTLLPGPLRQWAGLPWILSVYLPITIAEGLGVPRGVLEQPSWIFGDPTPGGWLLIVVSWALAWFVVARLWVAWRK
jgi:hypothetical protein